MPPLASGGLGVRIFMELQVRLARAGDRDRATHTALGQRNTIRSEPRPTMIMTPASVAMIDVAGRSVSGEKYAKTRLKVRTGSVSFGKGGWGRSRIMVA